MNFWRSRVFDTSVLQGVWEFYRRCKDSRVLDTLLRCELVNVAMFYGETEFGRETVRRRRGSEMSIPALANVAELSE